MKKPLGILFAVLLLGACVRLWVTAPPPPAAPAASIAALPTEEIPQSSPTAAPATAAPPTATPGPTAIPTPTPTTAPTRTPEPTPYASGGLGWTIGEWQARYGQPEKDGMTDIYLGTYKIIRHTPYVMHFWRNFSPARSINYAYGSINSFIPDDAEMLETYTPEDRPSVIVDLYMSPSLAQHLGDKGNWKGGEPGNFTVSFNLNPDSTGVTGVVVSTGNSP